MSTPESHPEKFPPAKLEPIPAGKLRELMRATALINMLTDPELLEYAKRDIEHTDKLFASWSEPVWDGPSPATLDPAKIETAAPVPHDRPCDCDECQIYGTHQIPMHDREEI